MSISRSIVRPLSGSVTRSIVQSGSTVDELQALIQQLFGNGEQGAFYLPQPAVNGEQVLFQDAAGAVPVTADGDSVGLMKDLSGSGNDASQPTSASRPTYRTDGTLHWLEFDGVDDFMSLNAPEFSSGISIMSSLSSVTIQGQHGVLANSDRWQNGSLYLRNSQTEGLAAASFDAGVVRALTASPTMTLGMESEISVQQFLFLNGEEIGVDEAGSSVIPESQWFLGYATGIASPSYYLGNIHAITFSNSILGGLRASVEEFMDARRGND